MNFAVFFYDVAFFNLVLSVAALLGPAAPRCGDIGKFTKRITPVMSILNTSPAKSTQKIKHLAFYSKLFACDPPTPQFYENLQVLPMGNVRHFRRIHKNDAPFLKLCVFR